MGDLIVGGDGRKRCSWGTSAPEYEAYHDEEWGRPVGADDRVYEKLCLEGFQAGLSWLTILRKRDAFRDAFAGFDPESVAAFDDRDVQRLLADAGIVRNRAKILATIANARATVALRARGESLARLMWAHRPSRSPAPRRLADLVPATAESKALSKALRGCGFAFVGPTTVYSAMQSLGVVNDHLVGCYRRDAVDTERRAFIGGLPARGEVPR